MAIAVNGARPLTPRPGLATLRSMPRTLQLRARPARRRCPLCHDALAAAAVAAACSACGGVIHAACVTLLGSRPCATHGCRGTPSRAARRSPVPPSSPAPPASSSVDGSVGAVVWVLGEVLLYAVALLAGC